MLNLESYLGAWDINIHYCGYNFEHLDRLHKYYKTMRTLQSRYQSPELFDSEQIALEGQFPCFLYKYPLFYNLPNKYVQILEKGKPNLPQELGFYMEEWEEYDFHFQDLGSKDLIVFHESQKSDLFL